MANPVFVACTADAWVKVATNISTGNLRRIIKTATYLQTYVLTTGTAPTDILEGTPIFRKDPDNEPISAGALVDIYIYCPGKAGRVRVDA